MEKIDVEGVRALDADALALFARKGLEGGPVVPQSGEANAVKVRRIMQLTRDLARRPFEDLRILDLGCGEGVYAIEAALRGAQVVALDREIGRLEQAMGIPAGSTELVPNIESARGIMQAYAIATASLRITGVAGSTEDLAADLGAPRSKTAVELAYARARLHLECTAADILSVDCPYTFADASGCEADALYSRQLGYVAKSAVDPDHVAIINRVMTPSWRTASRTGPPAGASRSACAWRRYSCRVMEPNSPPCLR